MINIKCSQSLNVISEDDYNNDLCKKKTLSVLLSPDYYEPHVEGTLEGERGKLNSSF